MQLAGDAAPFGFLRTDDLAQQFAQDLLTLLRLLLQQGVGDRKTQLLGNACHQRRLGRAEVINHVGQRASTRQPITWWLAVNGRAMVRVGLDIGGRDGFRAALPTGIQAPDRLRAGRAGVPA